jgi:hypothetical protein
MRRISRRLLEKLGVNNYTKRHLRIIDEFIANEETDCEKLLDSLGSWDDNDLTICESWINEQFSYKGVLAAQIVAIKAQIEENNVYRGALDETLQSLNEAFKTASSLPEEETFAPCGGCKKVDATCMAVNCFRK